MKSILAFLVAASSLLSSVSAHGYISWAIINNVNQSGWNPNVDPYLSPTPQRIFRPIPGNGPVTDLSLIDVQCNGYTDGSPPFVTKPAPISQSVPAGGNVELEWTQWPDSHKGPLITYMAKCPGSCSSYMPGSAAVWFKVAQSGYTNGVWATDPLETDPAAPYNFEIPATLAAGNYIVRHEIIALHAAYSYPGAQVYPSCFQVTVTGSGTKSPSSLVAFPGAYTGNTPGITYNIYTMNTTSVYPIPGPAVWTG
ncbi:Esterase/lipase/thioesterase [Thelotrema lepadinum]|nr:Esterase/lipase/thioesterase [Thelotrema lepadinum]